MGQHHSVHGRPTRLPSCRADLHAPHEQMGQRKDAMGFMLPGAQAGGSGPHTDSCRCQTSPRNLELVITDEDSEARSGQVAPQASCCCVNPAPVLCTDGARSTLAVPGGRGRTPLSAATTAQSGHPPKLPSSRQPGFHTWSV